MVKRAAYYILSVFWLMLLFWAGYETASKSNVYSTLFAGKGAITNRISEAKTSIVKNCWHHDEMVDLYGGWARLMDQRRCNGVVQCKGGGVSKPLHKHDISQIANKVSSLACSLRDGGIPFLFVQCPYKSSLTESVFPNGTDRDYSNVNVDELLQKLNSSDVATLDLRPYIAANCQQLMENYFRTDHHWNFDGAMKVFPIVVDNILKRMCVTNRLPVYATSNSWRRIKADRMFLGSLGRRTGVYYAGMDELYYYLPRFNTEMSTLVVTRTANYQIFKEGPFDQCVFHEEYLKKPTSHFVDKGYGLYDNDHPLMQYRNKTAPIKKRILLLKDSFGLPLAAFMSTIFEAVDMIDLRHYHELPLLDYVDINKPDLVCSIYNGEGLLMNNGFWSAHVGDGVVHRRWRVANLEHMIIERKESDYNYRDVLSGLKRGARYLLTAHNIQTRSSSADQVTVGIVDGVKGKLVVRSTIGLLPRSSSVYLRCPDVGGPYTMVVYAGKMGATKGVELECDEVKVDLLDYEIEHHGRKAAEVNNVVIESKKISYNYKEILTGLTKGAGYLLSIHNIRTCPAQVDQITVGIVDCSKGRLVTQSPVSTARESSGAYLVCPDRGGPFSLVIYAGTMGKTKDIRLECDGVTIEMLN